MIFRTLQLCIAISLLLSMVAASIHRLIIHDRWSDLIYNAIMLTVVLFITYYNARFDWMYLKQTQYKFSPPTNSWVIGVLCVLIPILLYAAGNFYATYDSHLSRYDVAVHMPESWWAPEVQWAAELILASTERSIYTLLFYIFMFSAFASISLSGYFSLPSGINTSPTLNWQLIISRLIIATVGLVAAVMLVNDIKSSIMYITNEGDEYPELRLFVNVAPVVIASLHTILMFAYFIWIGVEGARALRVKMNSLKSVAGSA